MSRTALIILNWNGWRDTLECLESVFNSDAAGQRILVVDNGSSDGSAAKIKARFGDRVDLLELPENIGFARGNNAGIRYALEHYDPEYLVVINNDTIVAPGFLGPLINAMENDPTTGLTAPQILDLPGKRFWQKPIPRRFNLLTYLLWATPLYLWTSRLIKLDLRQPSRVYAVPGSCFCFRRSTLEKIGLFDEQTFLGSEEYIVAEKLRQIGATTYFVTDSVIYHRVGRSTGRIGSAEKIKAFLRSERYCLIKYYRFGLVSRLLIRIVRLIIYFAKMIVNRDMFAWINVLFGAAL